MKCFNLLQKEYVVMGKKELRDLLESVRSKSCGIDVYVSDLDIHNNKEWLSTVKDCVMDLNDDNLTKVNKYLELL